MAAPTIVWLRPGVGYEPAAAASMRRLESAFVRRYGRQRGCNSTYRDYGLQLSMWQAWTAWTEGRGPKPNHSRALHPDASMHCQGLADDTDEWTTPGYIDLAAEHGWIRTAADDPTERHHFEYQWWRDQHRNEPAGDGATAFTPAALPEKAEDDMPDSMFAVVDGVPSWCWINWAVGKVFACHTQEDADWVGRYMGSIPKEFVFSGPDAGDLYKNKLAMLGILGPDKIQVTIANGTAVDYDRIDQLIRAGVAGITLRVPTAEEIADAVNDEAHKRSAE